MALNTESETIRDPYQHKKKWLEHKNKRDKDLTTENHTTIREYLHDMEHGINVGGCTKGGRSYTRLRTIKSRMNILSKFFQTETGKNLTELNEEDVLMLFSKMRKGEIQKQKGKGTYKSIGEYCISFKAFWHWHQRHSRKVGTTVADITVDLDTTDEKPKFVYLSEEDVRRLTDQAKNDYRMLIWFLFDTGIRTGGELHNVQKKDLHWDERHGNYVLSIKEEASKTYGRDIKLLLCSEMLQRYVKDMKEDTYLFNKTSAAVNKYLKRLAKRVFGDNSNTKPRANPYTKLTSYDFRHSSACYWLLRYKSESALKYRFGWKESSMIHYYTEFMGMKDTIQEEDVLDADTKHDMEKQHIAHQQQNARLLDDMEQRKTEF